MMMGWDGWITKLPPSQTDLSISNAIVKTGTGFGAGVLLSALLFRRGLHLHNPRYIPLYSLRLIPSSQAGHGLSGSSQALD